jgi:hypothetical protein
MKEEGISIFAIILKLKAVFSTPNLLVNQSMMLGGEIFASGSIDSFIIMNYIQQFISINKVN